MWISQQMIATQKQQPAAELTKVTGASSLQGTNSYRGVPTASPWGVAGMPPNSAHAIVVNTGSGLVCVGTLTEGAGLEPGELKLFSSGGAEIYLKNSGEVVINGQVFAAKGEG